MTPSPSSRRTGLVISEIMYNPPDRDDGKNLEFLELYNTTPFTNRLEGYYLTGDVSYAFSASDVIPPFGYLVVAASPSAMQSVYTNLTAVVGPYSGKLPNSSGLIELRKTRPVAGQMDALFLDVEYADTPPWPLSPDGAGHSLVLSRGTYGASDPRAWSASAALGGTPAARR
ncbi:MAG: lamin tail domain-containing protein [Kiritimatiellae bacterium]|nr:lamin tail domain-containing protein [Kiritimatiellia bacterium]